MSSAPVTRSSPSPIDLAALLGVLRCAFGGEAAAGVAESTLGLKVIDALRRLDADDAALAKYSLSNSSMAYTRNLVVQEATFALLVLVWTPHRGTAIHDHPSSHGCFMRVLEGRVEETRFSRDERGNALIASAVTVAAAGTVAFVESGGLHRLENHGDTFARTLHVYAPPASHVSLWLRDDTPLSEALRVPCSVYSVGGVPCAAALAPPPPTSIPPMSLPPSSIPTPPPPSPLATPATTIGSGSREGSRSSSRKESGAGSGDVGAAL